MFPEICYQFRTPKDTASSTVEVVHRTFTLNQNAASIFNPNNDDIFMVPVDKVLILQNFMGAFTGTGGVSTVYYGRLGVILNTAALIHWIRYTEGIGVTTSVYTSCAFQGEILIPPGAFLYAHVLFSGAGAGNALQASMSGVLIPRGNIGIA